MPDELVFPMGQYQARIPSDRWFSDNHLWLKRIDDAYRVGFTAYSVRLLQDVYFLEWTVEAGSPVERRQEIGEIESSKALSTLYAPAAGRIVRFNDELLEDPSLINADNYGRGWLFELRTEESFLTALEYVELLKSIWPETQRLIKGQLT
ncbi:MAG: glycine cleavage system protein H [Planctomycetes bacterium]|nr:glycine cleavage system protein H [Planctomycetota bacterium]